MKTLFAAGVAVVLALGSAVPGRAEVEEVRFARQIDIAYMPLAIMEDNGLVEKHASQLGLTNLKVNWMHMRGGRRLTMRSCPARLIMSRVVYRQ